MKIFSKDVVGGRETDSSIHNTSNSLPNTVKTSMTLVWHKLLQTIHLSFPLPKRNQELQVDMLLIQVCLRDWDEKINETVNTIDMIHIGSGLADFSSVQEIACWTSECCHCITIRRFWLKSTFNVSESECEAAYLRSICVYHGTVCTFIFIIWYL